MLVEVVYGVALLAMLGCVKYYWKRRRLYQCARQRPGPFALPFIGNAFYLAGRSKDIFDKVFKFHSVFASPAPLWLGPHLFFVIWDPKNLKVVLNNQHCLGKSFFYKYIEDAIGRGLISHDVTKWRRHRKLIAPIFTKKILTAFVEVFYDKSLIMLKRLESYAGKGRVDVFDICSCYAVDVLMQTGVGVNVNAQTSDCNQAQWFNTAKDITFIRMNNVFYHFDCIFKLSSYSKQFDQAINNIETMIGSVVKERIGLCALDAKHTFLQQLIEASGNDDAFTDVDLREEVITFLIGGNDTVATTLSYTLMVLGIYPDIQEKLYVEIKNTVGLNTPITHTDLCNFTYTERVIKETLRLFPPAPCVSREVTEDIHLEDCTIPSGSSIGIAIIALHRDPNVWPDPLKFDPDRFLPESSRDPYTWLPFSGGPRNCVAFKYALMVIKVAITSLIRKYQVSSTYKNIADVKFQANLLLKPIDGYKIAIKLRE